MRTLTDACGAHKTQVPCKSTTDFASSTFSGTGNSKRPLYYPSHTLSTPWPIAGPITNVPLRVYALVVDLHVAGVSEDLYPDDRLRFGIAMDLHAFHSGVRMEDDVVPAFAICWY